MSKINFLIISPEFKEKSGGTVVLQKLANLLAQLGENSYISTPIIPNSSAIFLNQEQIMNLDKNCTMVIYPEIVTGNPYGAKYITRWLLNTPGFIGGDGKYNDTDLIYKYWNYFKLPNENKITGELRCFDLKLDIYYNKQQERLGECFLIKKAIFFNKILNKHSSNSLNIDNFISDQYLSNIFNEKLIFISYDALTYHSIQAALCGCISVVIPDPNVSKEEWINKAPICKYGIAYGLEDISWAKETMHLVRDYVLSLEQESLNLVKSYISNCYKHMKY